MKKVKLLGLAILILGLSFITTPVAAADDSDYPWWDGESFPYDTNWDGEISKSEALKAIADYFDGKITKQLALEVIALYFA